MVERMYGAERVDYLKSFVNRPIPEYEMVYSVLQHTNVELLKRQQEFNRSSAGKRTVSFGFGRATYYRLRCAKDGFFVHSARNLTDIQSYKVTKGASGVVSNTFWSIQEGKLIYDDERLEKLQSQQGMGWMELAEQASHHLLSLGLLVRKGTVIWEEDNFTATSVDFGILPRQLRGQPAVMGTLIRSNNLPVSIKYSLFDSNRWIIKYDYDTPLAGDSNIPKRLEVESIITGWRDTFTFELISLIETNFPAHCTGPNQFESANTISTVLHVGKNQMELTRSRGKASKIALPIKTAQREGSKRTVLIAALIITSLFPLFWSIRVLLKRK